MPQSNLSRSFEWMAMCTLMFSYVLKRFAHKLHSNLRSWWIVMWLLRPPLSTNAAGHESHLKFLPSVCDLVCAANPTFDTKPIPQVSHINCRLLWITLCEFNFLLLTNSFPQTVQMNFGVSRHIEFWWHTNSSSFSNTLSHCRHVCGVVSTSTYPNRYLSRLLSLAPFRFFCIFLIISATGLQLWSSRDLRWRNCFLQWKHGKSFNARPYLSLCVCFVCSSSGANLPKLMPQLWQW
jgi:hypothetical protein